MKTNAQFTTPVGREAFAWVILAAVALAVVWAWKRFTIGTVGDLVEAGRDATMPAFKGVADWWYDTSGEGRDLSGLTSAEAKRLTASIQTANERRRLGQITQAEYDAYRAAVNADRVRRMSGDTSAPDPVIFNPPTGTK